MNGLGRLIKRLRVARELTQVELAARVGIEQTYISQIERGYSNTPGREIMHRLADALGTTDEELYRAAGEIRSQPGDPPPLEPELQSIRTRLQQLPEEARRRRLTALARMAQILDEADNPSTENGQSSSHSPVV